MMFPINYKDAQHEPGTDYVCVWVDGIHLMVRLIQDKVVPVGDDRGPRRRHQELTALDDGHQESAHS